MRVILTAKPRKKSFLPVEAESIVPAHFLNESAAAGLTAWEGNKERKLPDLFTITREGEAAIAEQVELVLRGDLSRFKRIGEYMEAGTIVVEGDIGMHCGNLMSGGRIEIHGNAEGWLGREMRGGSILCRGNASHYVASGYRGEKKGMRGGSVEVRGNAGDYAAEYLAGGTVTIHGNAGDLPGVEMIDGTLVIGGDCTRACGNMTGGVAEIYGTVSQMIPTFRKKGVATRNGARMTVFEGDIANRGKGTLFIRDYTY
ncbi:MAG: formylmethanofuran dehydrogenase subunit C [Methanomicrobiales archaeon]|nr:formylmethanofuran dehydrogenase subunit C [Methanomicrobiales archaeon]